MAFKNYREESRIQWGRDQDGSMTIEQINCGCMLRIADATELMAKNHAELVRERDRALESAKEWEAEAHRLFLSYKGLRGVITKMRNEREKKKPDFGVYRHTATRTYKKGPKP